MKLKEKKRNILRGIGARTTISHITVAVSIILFASILIFMIMSSYMRNYMQEELMNKAVLIGELESDRKQEETDNDRVSFYEELTQSTVMFFTNEYVLIDNLPSTGSYLTEEYYVIGKSWEF